MNIWLPLALGQFQPQHGDTTPPDAWFFAVHDNGAIAGAHTMMWECNPVTNAYVFTS